MANLEKYYKKDQDSGCWNFIKTLEHNGYGRVCFNYKRIPAHRFFYEKYKGLIPLDFQIDHLCKNRACVNPDHLEAVTQLENVHRSSATKLSKEDVIEIRTSYKTGTKQSQLATLFKVGQDQISRIINFKRWATI